MALTGGIAIATQLAALAPAHAATPPTITIAATSKMKPVTGDVYVVFHGGTFSSAIIQATINAPSSGNVARLYAQRFPYTKPAKAVQSYPFNTGGTTTTFSFPSPVTPTLATRYTVKLFASSTSSTPLATSPMQYVYVVPGGSVKGGGSRCGRPVCHQTLRLFVVLPASALRHEMSKHLYPYFGIRLGNAGIPPAPRWLYLNAGHATVAPARRISASEYEETVKYSFTIGNHAANYRWTQCWKDTVSKDGLGLPGHHGCGASRVLRTAPYLG